MRFRNYIIPFTGLLLLTAGILSSSRQEEGMFPLNYLNEKALHDAGLKLSVDEIFNPGNVALTNALVKVGGCTGSFISDEGLIITNHHCVYGGVADLSNAEHNYLENGFVAGNHEMEIPINMPCRITQSYEDVSARVLEGIDDKTDPQNRSRIIAGNIKNIRDEESKLHPDLSNEVSEMFVGKSYMLFRYFLITDVRLVYVPPVTIGQFGGDLDNWEWPRHNGDFSLVRAYVGKDGKPAGFSRDNVPYKPARHLKINAKGSRENDFVFIMGYPGRTYRHECAAYMKFQQDFQLPEIQKWYAWNIEEMEKAGKNDVNKSLAFAGTIQQLANTEKNFRGKMQGLTRTGLVQKKIQDELAMQRFADENNLYKGVIGSLNSLWKQKTELAERRYSYLFLNAMSNVFSLTRKTMQIDEYLDNARSKEDKKKGTDELQSYVKKSFSIIDAGYETAVVREMLKRISKFRDLKSLTGKRSVDQWVDEVFSKKEKMLDTQWVNETARKNPSKLANYEGPAVALAEFIEPDLLSTEAAWQDLETNIKALMPQYLDLKQAYKSSQFIPDANSTLRLTYGYIRRYSPNDAEIDLPFTTLRGVFEKANTAPDYRLPQVMADNLRIADVPPFFKDPETGEVIVCFLYNLDTTGGNSGSPVLDANGNLIGVNFDRSFTATINDYAWNEKYSRSIGVDIRYVLYVMKYVGHADHLIKELGMDI